MPCTKIYRSSPTIARNSAASPVSRWRAGFGRVGEDPSKFYSDIFLVKALYLGTMGKLAQMIGLAPEGGKLAFGILIAGLLFLFVGFPILGVPLILLAVAVGSFFRDPERFPERTD